MKSIYAVNVYMTYVIPLTVYNVRSPSGIYSISDYEIKLRIILYDNPHAITELQDEGNQIIPLNHSFSAGNSPLRWSSYYQPRSGFHNLVLRLR